MKTIEQIRAQKPIDYEMLPAPMRESVQAYIEYGRPFGHFLTAVFSNKLVEAYGRADEENREAMPAYAQFVYNEAPAICWGSENLVERWIADGGLFGIENRTLKEAAKR